VIIVDCESGSASHPVLGRWEQLAREWEADYLRPEDIVLSA
jgi:hypothetical protein